MTEPARPQGRREVKELLARHGLHPKKAFGQNFLVDPNIVDRIVALAAVGPGDQVLEVGAGTGTLTRALAETGARVVAYEIDSGLIPVLAEAVAGVGNVEVIHADAAGTALVASLGAGPWAMVANLPYNVGTPLLLELLQHAPAITRFVVMVQLEVAERLDANPGSKTYGIPSVIAALHGVVDIAFRVPPTVFFPQPGVDSAVVVVERRNPPAEAPAAIALAAAAFGQRRKMVRRSLTQVLEDPGAVLTAAGIEPTARAENLSPMDYVMLARAAS